MPAPIKRKNDKSQFWWLRKKVPVRLRPLIGQAEVWRSLGTTPKRRIISVIPNEGNTAREGETDSNMRVFASGRAAPHRTHPDY
jgi:hypothetical protein